ncbi:hypothetical protein GCM10020295_12880 [Streptomyces cinereospinus]
MSHAGPVAVVTEVDDVTADMVITELNKRGVPVVRFDPSDIGDRLLLSARFGASLEAAPRRPPPHALQGHHPGGRAVPVLAPPDLAPTSSTWTTPTPGLQPPKSVTAWAALSTRWRTAAM